MEKLYKASTKFLSLGLIYCGRKYFALIDSLGTKYVSYISCDVFYFARTTVIPLPYWYPCVIVLYRSIPRLHFTIWTVCSSSFCNSFAFHLVFFVILAFVFLIFVYNAFFRPTICLQWIPSGKTEWDPPLIVWLHWKGRRSSFSEPGQYSSLKHLFEDRTNSGSLITFSMISVKLTPTFRPSHPAT